MIFQNIMRIVSVAYNNHINLFIIIYCTSFGFAISHATFMYVSVHKQNNLYELYGAQHRAHFEFRYYSDKTTLKNILIFAAVNHTNFDLIIQQQNIPKIPYNLFCFVYRWLTWRPHHVIYFCYIPTYIHKKIYRRLI